MDLHNQSLAGHVKLEAPKLAQLDTIVPTLSGRANGTVDIGGTLSNPAIRAGIRASHLTFEDLRVESAKLDIQVRDRTAPDNRAILDLKDVSSADLHYDHIELKALGALQRHRIGLVSHGTPASFSSTLEASVDSSLSQWHASVLAGQISTVAGSWTASSPVELNLQFRHKVIGAIPPLLEKPKSYPDQSEGTLLDLAPTGKFTSPSTPWISRFLIRYHRINSRLTDQWRCKLTHNGMLMANRN